MPAVVTGGVHSDIRVEALELQANQASSVDFIIESVTNIGSVGLLLYTLYSFCIIIICYFLL